MGCDIHIIAEVKRNGKWEKNTEKVFGNPYYLSDEELKERQKDNPKYTKYDFQENELEVEPGSGRNYDWFSILANVRNGRGFAGCITGEGFNVIAEPKGVPEDCCEEWNQYIDDYGCDLHSRSWLTIEEFDAFDWNNKTFKTGVISLEQYKELTKDETDQLLISVGVKEQRNVPKTWSGWISGPGISVVNEDTAKRILDGEKIEGTHVQYSWQVTYSEWFEHQIKDIIEPLRKLKEKYEDARIVFAFDN